MSTEFDPAMPSDLGSGAVAPRWLTTLDQTFAERLVDVGEGTVVAVREAGAATAPVVVLLHGIGSGAASWLPVAWRLSARARVLAWDAPGYGASTPLPEAAPTAQSYANRLKDVLDALGVEHCLLVGHSLGALMAAAFTRTQPMRVQRLLLLSPAGGYGAPALTERAEAVRQERLTLLDRLGVAGMARDRGPRLVRPQADADTRAWAAWNMARLHAHGYRQAVELLCRGDLAAMAPLSVPVDVHVGDEDTVTPPARVAELAAAFGAPCHAIAQAGHLCALDQAQAVAALIAQALPGGTLTHAASGAPEERS